MGFNKSAFLNLMEHFDEKGSHPFGYQVFLEELHSMPESEFEKLEIDSLTAQYLFNALELLGESEIDNTPTEAGEAILKMIGGKSISFEDYSMPTLSDEERNKVKGRIKKLSIRAIHKLARILMDKEMLTEINEIKSKGKGRPKQNQADRIKLLQSRINHTSKPQTKDDLFLQEIEELKQSTGSYSQAYEVYAKTHHIEPDSVEKKHKRIRRRSLIQRGQ
ncbi:hypothetical protein [Thiomicrorhabdus xiamenensis]|uniref:Uncharacterized protein n=1 Tax=Thiomicrorhabdus xiamenensis TaxID=2739063 RepID=A0A7D4NXH5_9GAMM|nr:hypothetical protein [Thiomicrorhabdus xiamenensis]QKI88538.1 hypothetical protein HQN79_02585 [Thiomicrorhabdus xiamenensis]